MSESNFRLVLLLVIIATLIALLAITADIMKQHPSIPWFIFGMLALAVAEGIGYGIYSLIKYMREQ